MTRLHSLAIDAEFTSFDMLGGDMISLALVEIMDDFTIGRSWQGFLRPDSVKYFTDSAQAVHGISYFKASTFPEAKETMIEMLHWLAPLQNEFKLAVTYWGSWNFDLKWIQTTMERCELTTSYLKAFLPGKESHHNALKLAKQKLKHVPIPDLGTDNESRKGQYKLDNVARFYGLNHNHHDALSDAMVTAQIYCNIMKGENVWTGELF